MFNNQPTANSPVYQTTRVNIHPFVDCAGWHGACQDRHKVNLGVAQVHVFHATTETWHVSRLWAVTLVDWEKKKQVGKKMWTKWGFQTKILWQNGQTFLYTNLYLNYKQNHQNLKRKFWLKTVSTCWENRGGGITKFKFSQECKLSDKLV